MATYPKLFIRVKAMLWDSIILSIFLLTMIMLSAEVGFENKYLQAAFFLIPTISLEPLLIYFTGSSFGHKIARIKITPIVEGKRLNILQCYLRFFFKALLGIYSFFSLLFTRKHQALHDLLSRTLVEFIDANKAPTNHKLSKQRNTYSDEKPSWGRRISIIFLYLVVVYLLLSISAVILISDNCLQLGSCNEFESNTSMVIGFGFIFFIVSIIILGAICKLPGAYYRPQLNEVK